MSEAQDIAGSDAMKPEGYAARDASLYLLLHVLQKKQPLDQALEREQRFKNLTARDRGFVRMLVSTALRRMGQIDDLIARAVEKQLPENMTLMNILRVGATQIVFMDVADHAAVDLSVHLSINHGLASRKGFVNGVLRTLTREGRTWVQKQDEVRLNTPEWLLKLWIDDYGFSDAAQIAAAHLSEAPLDITIKDEADRNYWASNLKATEMLTGTLRKISGGAVHELPGFDDGDWWVQDASAAIPAKLFGEIKGQIVYDLCSAPGGKTLQLASMGANVNALDRSANRLKRLDENLRRMGLSEKVRVLTEDAASWALPEPASFILLDAPCSATGTIRRHPDVPHLKNPVDIERLVSTQASILENAFAQLMVGGILVYCTCSIQRVEGEVQIDGFLARHDDAKRIPIVADELGGWDEAISAQGDLRILPYHQAAIGGMDGFYVARLTKV